MPELTLVKPRTRGITLSSDRRVAHRCLSSLLNYAQRCGRVTGVHVVVTWNEDGVEYMEETGFAENGFSMAGALERAKGKLLADGE